MDDELPLWHVTLTVGGDPVDPRVLHDSLERLGHERPFLLSARYSQERAEIRYWDEAEDIDDAAALALRLWMDHRESAGLPDWHVLGLEVLDRSTQQARSQPGGAVVQLSSPLVIGDVRPL